MTDERWQLAYAIYEGAVPLAEPSRRQYVQAAAPDAEIAGRVLMSRDAHDDLSAAHLVDVDVVEP